MRRLVSAIAALAACALVLAGPAAAQDPTATTGLPAPAPAPSTAPAAPPAATTQTPPATSTTTAGAPAAASDDDGPSPLLVGGIVLAVLALLVLLAAGLIRLTAWEPAWLPRARHALGEAAYRGGATWDEFRDWLRPRRAR
jgi:hypothetical protein